MSVSKILLPTLLSLMITSCIPLRETTHDEVVRNLYDMETGSPISGVKVGRAFRKNGKIKDECTTNKQGKFKLRQKHRIYFVPPIPIFSKRFEKHYLSAPFHKILLKKDGCDLILATDSTQLNEGYHIIIEEQESDTLYVKLKARSKT
jgi:hypothetical protein